MRGIGRKVKFLALNNYTDNSAIHTDNKHRLGNKNFGGEGAGRNKGENCI